MFKFSLLCLLFSLCYLTSSEEQDDNRLTVSVYYEALCPDSIKFVNEQLFPNFIEFGKSVFWELVPYGNANTSKINGKWFFTCQHGPKECYANKFHSCSLALNYIQKGIKFVHCSMNATDPSSSEVLEKCSSYAEIDWQRLLRCFKSGKANTLLAENGNKTAAVTPHITWIPTVVFNKYYNSTIETRALSNLKTVLCDLLGHRPNPCRNDIEVIAI